MPRSTTTTNGDQPHRTVLVLVLGTVGTWSTGICPHRTMLVLGLVPWAPWAPSRYLYTSKGSPPFGSFEVRLVYILDLYVPSIHCHDYSPTSPDTRNVATSALKDETNSQRGIWTVASFATTPYPLKDSVIWDSGAECHVVNDRSRFEELRSAEGQQLIAGEKEIVVEGIGNALVQVETPRGKEELFLGNALFVPGFHTSCAAVEMFEKKGAYWDQKQREVYTENHDGTRHVLAKLEKRHGQNVLEYNPVPASTANASITKAPVNPTAELWHLRMGHPGAQVLQHLPNNVKISKNEAIKAIDCDECAVATAKNIVSRTPAERAKTPYYRLHFDLFEFDRAYNGNRYVAFFVDDATGTVHTELLNTKTELLDTVIDLQARIKKMGKDIAMLHSDNDTSLGKAFEKWAKDEGIVVEMSAPATQAQNGRAERSGGVVIAKARKMRIGARLPKDLWPEIILCAAYIHNRTPTSQNNWESPITKLKSWFAQKDQETAAVPPDTIDHLRAYGCRAYPLTMNTKLNKNRKDKLQPKAHIGYLVGYKARTIYRIWVPVLQKVIVTRDVTFNESQFFDPDEEDLSMKLRSTIEPLAETLELPEMPEHPDHPEQYLHDRTAFDDDGELQHEITEQPPHQQFQEQEAEEPPHLPTPERTPQPEVKPQRKKAVRDQGMDLSNVLPTRTRRHASAVAHREESDVEKKHDDYEETAPFQYAFAGAMMHSPHQSNLPPEPHTWKDAMSSELMQKWKDAAQEELGTLNRKNTWTEESRTDLKGKRPLPVKWVFKYKLDASGYLLRCKARLCVRGDLQPISETFGNTRATTLTMRSFRMLAAIAAKFDLDAEQLDAVNAFVNSSLQEDEKLHVELPDGFRRNNVVLKLHKALYGLRRAPKLWQEELSGTLKRLCDRASSGRYRDTSYHEG